MTWLVEHPDDPAALIGPPVDAVICKECDWWLPCVQHFATDVLFQHGRSAHPQATTLSAVWVPAMSYITWPGTSLDLGIVRA